MGHKRLVLINKSKKSVLNISEDPAFSNACNFKWGIFLSLFKDEFKRGLTGDYKTDLVYARYYLNKKLDAFEIKFKDRTDS